MQKVKRQISLAKNKDEVTELQNEIKNSSKSLYIKDKENTKTINNYASMISKIKEEYALVYKENAALKKTIDDMKNRIAPQPRQNYYPFPKQNYYKQPKKRVMHNYVEDNDENDDVQYVVKNRRNAPLKK